MDQTDQKPGRPDLSQTFRSLKFCCAEWFFRSFLIGGIREHQGLFDPVFMKTTKAFERGLEGLEMVAPRAGLEPATSRLTAGCSTN
jgi:hypothetical protein